MFLNSAAVAVVVFTTASVVFLPLLLKKSPVALVVLTTASVVFFPSLVKLADRRVLAASLGFASGVMMYVAFLDIWAKGIGSFEEAGNEPAMAYLYTTLSFFGGAIIMMVGLYFSS